MYDRGKKTDPNIPTMPAGLAVRYDKTVGESDKVRYNVFVCPAALHAMEQTVAHELGHAGFELVDLYLQGTPERKKKDKSNLMNDGGGEKLRKYQWDKIHK